MLLSARVLCLGHAALLSVQPLVGGTAHKPELRPQPGSGPTPDLRANHATCWWLLTQLPSKPGLVTLVCVPRDDWRTRPVRRHLTRRGQSGGCAIPTGRMTFSVCRS